MQWKTNVMEYPEEIRLDERYMNHDDYMGIIKQLFVYQLLPCPSPASFWNPL